MLQYYTGSEWGSVDWIPDESISTQPTISCTFRHLYSRTQGKSLISPSDAISVPTRTWKCMTLPYGVSSTVKCTVNTWNCKGALYDQQRLAGLEQNHTWSPLLVHAWLYVHEVAISDFLLNNCMVAVYDQWTGLLDSPYSSQFTGTSFV